MEYCLTLNNLSQILLSSGYSRMNTNVSNVTFFIKNINNSEKIKIVGITSSYVKNPIRGQDMELISDNMKRKFLLTGSREVDILYIVLSENIEKDKYLNTFHINFWLYDNIGNQLIIFENQPDNFDYLRDIVIGKYHQSATINRPVYANPTGYGRPYPSGYQNQKEKMTIKDFPFFTVALIFINVLIFVIMEVMSFGLSDSEKTIFFLNHGAAEAKQIFDSGEIYRLFTCMFLHLGISHIFGNMIALLFVGKTVEKEYGRLHFLIIYFGTGLIASLVSAICNYNNYVVSLGASGAIYGITGAMVIYLLAKNRSMDSGVIKFIVIIGVLFYAGKSGMSNNGDTQVDYIAHLAGVAAGMIYGLIYTTLKRLR